MFVCVCLCVCMSLSIAKCHLSSEYHIRINLSTSDQKKYKCDVIEKVTPWQTIVLKYFFLNTCRIIFKKCISF